MSKSIPPNIHRNQPIEPRPVPVTQPFPPYEVKQELPKAPPPKNQPLPPPNAHPPFQ